MKSAPRARGRREQGETHEIRRSDDLPAVKVRRAIPSYVEGVLVRGEGAAVERGVGVGNEEGCSGSGLAEGFGSVRPSLRMKKTSASSSAEVFARIFERVRLAARLATSTLYILKSTDPNSPWVGAPVGPEPTRDAARLGETVKTLESALSTAGAKKGQMNHFVREIIADDAIEQTRLTRSLPSLVRERRIPDVNEVVFEVSRGLSDSLRDTEKEARTRSRAISECDAFQAAGPRLPEDGDGRTRIVVGAFLVILMTSW